MQQNKAFSLWFVWVTKNERSITRGLMITSCGTDKPKRRQICFIGTFRKSIETGTSGFWKALGTYWYFKQNITNNSRIAKPLGRWTKTLELYIVNLVYTMLSKIVH